MDRTTTAALREEIVALIEDEVGFKADSGILKLVDRILALPPIAAALAPDTKTVRRVARAIEAAERVQPLRTYEEIARAALAALAPAEPAPVKRDCCGAYKHDALGRCPKCPERAPAECPRCGSSAPHMHPAVQHEGEVQVCTDPFHLTPTPQNKPAYIEAVQTARVEPAGRKCCTPDGEVVSFLCRDCPHRAAALAPAEDAQVKRDCCGEYVAGSRCPACPDRCPQCKRIICQCSAPLPPAQPQAGKGEVEGHLELKLAAANGRYDGAQMVIRQLGTQLATLSARLAEVERERDEAIHARHDARMEEVEKGRDEALVGVCEGCGSSWTDAVLNAGGYLSCCPERNMLTAKQWAERAKALTEEVGRLRGVLEPFATCAAVFGLDWSTYDELAVEPFEDEAGGGNGNLLFTLKVGHFRAAARTLSPGNSSGGFSGASDSGEVA